jgi:hypothetical protein
MTEPVARRRRLVAVAVVIAAALWVAAAIYLLAIGRPRSRLAAVPSPVATPRQSPPPTPARSPTAPSPTRAPAHVEAVVAELEAFVEEHHGMRFAHDVDVQVLDDAAFRLAWADSDTGREDPLAHVRYDTYAALGLVEPGTELNESEAAFNEAVAGFYDDDADLLVVHGSELTPFVRGVLVHELTHALQHHNFSFESGPHELVDPLSGLLEGGASWTESAYYDSLSAAEQREYDDEVDRRYSDRSKAAPEPLDRLWSFPYEVGEDFVEDLVKGGHGERLVAAYERPPTTSEQLLYLKAYRSMEQAKQVPPPDDDHPPLDHGTLGEAGLRVVLAEQISDEIAEGAARGWGGDRYLVWRQLGEICARVNITMDTPRDSAELRRAFDSYASKRSGTTVSSAKVSGAEILAVTMCAPE